jgi:hypothetical protein
MESLAQCKSCSYGQAKRWREQDDGSAVANQSHVSATALCSGSIPRNQGRTLCFPTSVDTLEISIMSHASCIRKPESDEARMEPRHQ